MLSSEYNDKIRKRVLLGQWNTVVRDNILNDTNSPLLNLGDAIRQGRKLINVSDDTSNLKMYGGCCPQCNIGNNCMNNINRNLNGMVGGFKVGGPLNGVMPSSSSGSQSYMARKLDPNVRKSGGSVSAKAMDEELRGQINQPILMRNLNRSLQTNPDYIYPKQLRINK